MGNARSELMESSVRLIMQDAKSRSYGSGTVIDCRQGEALIVTCGHISSRVERSMRISVDLFGPNAERQLPGRVIFHNLDSDVGLIAIRVQQQVRVAHVAKEGTKFRKVNRFLRSVAYMVMMSLRFRLASTASTNISVRRTCKLPANRSKVAAVAVCSI